MSGQQRAGQRAEAAPDHGGREAGRPPHSPRPSCGSGFRGFLWIQSLPTFIPEVVGSPPFPKLITDTLVQPAERLQWRQFLPQAREHCSLGPVVVLSLAHTRGRAVCTPGQHPGRAGLLLAPGRGEECWFG